MEKIEAGIIEGIAKYNEGEYEKALGIFDSLLSSMGDDILALFYKGNTLGALGNFNDAISCFDKILGSDPKNEKAKKAKEIFKNIEKNSFSQKISSPKISESIMQSSAMPAPSSSVGPISHSEDYSLPKIKKEFCIADKSRGGVPFEVDSESLKQDIELDFKEIKEEVTGGNKALYNFLKSNEAEDFFQKDELKNIEFDKIIDNYCTNDFDKEVITGLIKSKKSNELAEFIKKVKLRNSVLDYLADSNVLPPRKYNTITSQIQNINAEFALAYLMFNIGEKKYNEILIKLGEKPVINIDGTDINLNTNGESEKISILKIIANFFIGIFSFEKAFANENNKLKYFKYLFVFLGFLSVMTLIGYGIKNDAFKADVKVVRKVTPNHNIESITEISSRGLKKIKKTGLI